MTAAILESKTVSLSGGTRGVPPGPPGIETVSRLDWPPSLEREFRAGQLSIKEIGRQHNRSDTAIRKHAKAEGWTRDLSAVVRNRVRESLVREPVRANLEMAGVVPSEAAIVDEAVARGVEVVRSHRQDIYALRQAAAGLLSDLGLREPPDEGQAQGKLLLKVTDRSRVIADLSLAMARLIPLERIAFGLDDTTQVSGALTIQWPLPKTALDEA